jgi:hypothetical protein
MSGGKRIFLIYTRTQIFSTTEFKTVANFLLLKQFFKKKELIAGLVEK